MRKLLAISALALTTTSYAAPPEHYGLRTAGDLARVCGTPASASDHATAIALCHGYFAGAYAYFLAATPPAERRICEPNPAPTRAKVADQFVAWVKGRPQVEKDSAVDTLFRFAAESFPCKG